MNRYAMPVHPEVLKKDFKSSSMVLQIPKVTAMLKLVKTRRQLQSISKIVFNILKELWSDIDLKRGINLRDREKLYPLLKEVSRIIGVGSYPYAYRGVRLSSFDPNSLSETYPDLETGEIINDPKEPRVLLHLESLAYGLRSWSPEKELSLIWSSYKRNDTRDRILFRISEPELVLDANSFGRNSPFLSKGNWNPSLEEAEYSIFDWNEILLFIKNPQILSIQKIEGNLYLVTIKDN